MLGPQDAQRSSQAAPAHRARAMMPAAKRSAYGAALRTGAGFLAVACAFRCTKLVVSASVPSACFPCVWVHQLYLYRSQQGMTRPEQLHTSLLLAVVRFRTAVVATPALAPSSASTAQYAATSSSMVTCALLLMDLLAVMLRLKGRSKCCSQLWRALAAYSGDTGVHLLAVEVKL